jgi:hypothetical protein
MNTNMSKKLLVLYTRAICLENGELSSQVSKDINNFDKGTIRRILEQRSGRLRQDASRKNPDMKAWLESQATGIQEVLANLDSILET